LFTKSYSGTTGYNQGNAILQSTDSGLVIGGYTSSFGEGNGDAYLLKTNKTGGLLFNSTFGGAATDNASAVVQTPDNGFVLSGYTQSYAVDSNSFYIVKTDGNGNSYSCNQTNPTPTIVTGGAIINTPATITNTPATNTATNTRTKIKSSVSAMNPCPTAGIKQVADNNKYQFVVYHNPSNGNITLKTDNPIDNAQVTIYNQLGQIVLKKTLTNESTTLGLDVNSGIYQVVILSKGELIYQTKIIKE